MEQKHEKQVIDRGPAFWGIFVSAVMFWACVFHFGGWRWALVMILFLAVVGWGSAVVMSWIAERERIALKANLRLEQACRPSVYRQTMGIYDRFEARNGN